MKYSHVAAVTGANKGIGYSIVRNLALSYSQSNGHKGPVLIYLTARDEIRGRDSLEKLSNDPQLRAAKALRSDGGPADIQYRVLDISNSHSQNAFENFIRESHPSGIDVLINNAGIAVDGFDREIVRKTLLTNYFGTLELTLRLLPLIKEAGRVVNIASMTGKLNKYSPQITDAFRSATSVSAVTELMERFQAAVDSGRCFEEGWPSSAYAVSKTGVIGFSHVVGTRLFHYGGKEGVLVNSCCPGYVKSDMTKHRGRKTTDQGAMTPVKLAREDIGGLSGEFWEHGQVSSW